MSARSQGAGYAGSISTFVKTSSSPKQPENMAGSKTTNIRIALRMPYGHVDLDLSLSIGRTKLAGPLVGGFMCCDELGKTCVVCLSH